MGTLLVVMLLIFLLGWPFEWPTIVFVFVPLFQPSIMALGYDPLWFAVLIAVNFQTTFLSPPVATAAYYLKAVAPDLKLTDIHWGMAEFMVLQLIGLLLVMLFPGSPCGFPTGSTGSERSRSSGAAPARGPLIASLPSRYGRRVLCRRLLRRSASESGRLCHGDGT